MDNDEYTSTGENPGALPGLDAAIEASAPPKHKHKWSGAKKRMARAVQQNSGPLADVLLAVAKDFDAPARIAPDEVVVKRALLQALRAMAWEQVDLYHSEGGEVWDDARDLLRRVDDALADGGGESEAGA